MSSGPFEPELDQASGLKLVDSQSESESAGETPTPDLDPERSEPRRLPAWFFVVAGVLFALLFGWQAQVASGLKDEVAALEGELEKTNTLLEAHRTHLFEIRGGVHELSESLLGLQALVDRDPSESVVPDASLTAPQAP